MGVVDKYNIAFSGLSTGVHHYEFDVDDTFFTAFEGSEIKKGNALANVALTKATGALSLDFNIKGTVAVECDRCMENCDIAVDYQGQLAVKFSETEMDESERYDGEVLWVDQRAGVVNTAQYIYESIVLNLPYQRVHPVGVDGNLTCDQGMLERFKIVTEKEFEELTTPKMHKMGDNPEFEKLKELRKKLK